MRNRLSSLCAAVALSIAATTCLAEHHESGHAKGPTLLWQVSELPAPESAVYDPASGNIYVSIIDGGPLEKNGTGRIAVISASGELKNPALVSGLHSPKGLALHDGRLYVADIDELVVIDVAAAEVVARHIGEEAQFLNDVAADADGNVYVSDMLANRLYRLNGGEFRVWNEDPELEFPNGVFVDGDQLLLGTWGPITEGFATSAPGRLRVLDPVTGTITDLPGTDRIGNLDGVERLADGRLVVTDWMVGKVFVVETDGTTTEVLDLGQGAADLGVIADRNILFIPHMVENRLDAYQLP